MTAVLYLFFLLAAQPVLVSCQRSQVQDNSAKGVSQSELKKTRLVAETNDLPSIKTVDQKNGATFLVYFDESSAVIAENSIPTLAAFYRQLADLSRADAGKVKWASVVFTQKTDYVQPRREGDVRWLVPTDKDGKLTAHGIVDFYLVIPHEQVHAIQKSFVPQHSARWFKEGQATWLGMKVTERWNPELARKEYETLASEQKKATEPLALRKWGSVRVSGGAIMRQMTPEEREKMKQNPNSVTSGSFTFSTGDIISDESNAKARYGAALNIFEEIEKKAGRQKINAWLKSIWEQKSELDTNTLIQLTLEKTGVDITERLK
jgi:hypothetical protein